MFALQILYKISLYFIKFSFYLLTVCIPIKNNKILFMAFHGRGILDNPKALYLELLSESRVKNYSIVWVINDKKEPLPNGVKAVKYQSLLYFYNLARCKFWIVNCKLPEYIHKKKSQIYIQTWHGTPLKRLGRDLIECENQKSRSGRDIKEIKDSYTIDAKRYNLMISPNTFCTKVFQSAFGVKKEQLVEIGYPRNDILYSPSIEKINRLKKKYKIPFGKKILLYAPTWRDDDYQINGYTFRLELDFIKWKNQLTDYLILFKPHYFIINSIKLDENLDDFVKVIDAKSDINDLYLISDCLVTDYSSVFFDYALLNRPIYFYMYDLEKYEKNLRGFYLNIHEDLPGEVFEREDELLKAISDNRFDYKRLKNFNSRFNSFQSNSCSKELLDIIFEMK